MCQIYPGWQILICNPRADLKKSVYKYKIFHTKIPINVHSFDLSTTYIKYGWSKTIKNLKNQH